MSPTIAFLISATVFGVASAVVIWLTAKVVREHVKVRRNLIWWFLRGEVERDKDPFAYWFFAGQIVLLLALIPLIILLTISQNIYRVLM